MMGKRKDETPDEAITRLVESAAKKAKPDLLKAWEVCKAEGDEFSFQNFAKRMFLPRFRPWVGPEYDQHMWVLRGLAKDDPDHRD